jgi:hypothetical protein
MRRYGLARLHPLLAHAMALKEANSITAAVTPLALHFPCDALSVRVLPLKLQIKGNRIFRGATRLLEGRCARHRPWLSGLLRVVARALWMTVLSSYLLPLLHPLRVLRVH